MNKSNHPTYKFARFVAIIFIMVSLLGSHGAGSAAQTNWQAKVDPWVLQTTAEGTSEFLVMLEQQADLSAARRLPTKVQKGAYVTKQLKRLAEKTQGPLIKALKDQDVEYRPYWVANLIWVRGDAAMVESLARRGDVAHIYANPQVKLEAPDPAEVMILPAAPDTPTDITWGLNKVNAPQVWAAGYSGQDVVIGGADTGYAWEHPALKGKYRGWDGFSADHNYSWHDAIHEDVNGNGTNSCGFDSVVPCDDHYHGTHTMGTMVGDDGLGNQIGMAPGAKWIGCRNMEEGWGSPDSYIECYEWFMEPTDLNGNNPEISMAPDVINNSWSCPVSEGCTDPNVMLTVVNNVRAAGIMTVHSAGNSGSSCSTVNRPGGIYDASFTVGNTTSSDSISSSSSRGPVTVDGSGRLKPDISAPGSGILSSIPLTGYASLSGTSMAAPHVAGLTALLISAQPNLAGQVDQLEEIITRSAVHLTTSQICGGVPGSQIPNNTFGWGRIDAWAALNYQALALEKQASTSQVYAGNPLTYTINLSYLAVISPTHNLVVSDVLPIQTHFFTATLPHSLDDGTVRWDFPIVNPLDAITLTVRVQVPYTASGTIQNQYYGARNDDFPILISGPVINTSLYHNHFFLSFVRTISINISFTHME